MALGNAWHFPGNPEPFGNAGMRDPVFPTDPVPTVTVFSGNQYQGGGNPGNQLQNGSAVRFKRTADTAWTTVPMVFATAIGDNKYYSAAIPVGAFATGTIVQYYLAGWPGASQPRAPTERSVKVSLYSARPIYRLNLNSVDHFQCANRSGCLSVRSFHHLRTFLYDLSRLYFHFAQRTR